MWAKFGVPLKVFWIVLLTPRRTKEKSWSLKSSKRSGDAKLSAWKNPNSKVNLKQRYQSERDRVRGSKLFSESRTTLKLAGLQLWLTIKMSNSQLNFRTINCRCHPRKQSCCSSHLLFRRHSVRAPLFSTDFHFKTKRLFSHSVSNSPSKSQY